MSIFNYLVVSVLTLGVQGAVAADPVLIGLDADMSGPTARAGEAIKRGAQIAIAEINEKGGVLNGRKLELVVKDHTGLTEKSIENVAALGKTPGVVGMIGGLNSPALIDGLKTIHEHKLPTVVAWAAATSIVENTFNPNYVYRVSVTDRYAGPFLVSQATKEGHSRIALVLEKTSWGRSNVTAMMAALKEKGLEPVTVVWYELSDYGKLDKRVAAAMEHKPTAVLLVANFKEGVEVLKAFSTVSEKQRPAILSHWGIAGGPLTKSVGADAMKNLNLRFLQTYSFIDNRSPAAVAVKERYKAMFQTQNDREIFAPVGTAHSYDAIHLMAKAIAKAGSTDRAKVRDAFENLSSHNGLVKNYSQPFSKAKHDALDMADYKLAMFAEDGAIVPATSVSPKN